MQALGYRLIDADEHYYEPDDCFSRHIEARFTGSTPSGSSAAAATGSAGSSWAPGGRS